MAKFCTKCGKKLEDGKKCSCEENKVETSNLDSFNFNNFLNSYLDILKGIFTRPIDTIKKYATSSNFVLGIIALLINCIVSGIFLYCFLGEALKSVGSLFGGYSSLLLMGGMSLEVPFIKTLLYGILFMAVGFIITALMIYLIAGVIFKDKVDFKKSLSLIGICSVFTTITTVLAIVCVYISIKFMFVVLLISGVFYLTYLYQGISEIIKLDKNKLAYVFVPAISIATFVVSYILPKILF